MTKKRILSLLLVCLFVFSAAACGNGGIDGNQADTDAVQTAVDKFRACESFTVTQHIDWTESVTMDGDIQRYKASNEMEISFISGEQPQMIRSASTRVENGGDIAEQSSISYIVPENGGYTEYIFDGSQWLKLATDDSSALSGISASSFANAYFTDFISFRKAAEDSLESGKAIRYDGSLSGEYLLAMLEVNGQLSDLDAMSESQQNKIRENLIKDLGHMTVSVWIDEASGYPVRFEAKLSEILDDMNESISKSLGNKTNSEWAITDYVLCMSAKDFDALSEIVLPPETADAKPYETA